MSSVAGLSCSLSLCPAKWNYHDKKMTEKEQKHSRPNIKIHSLRNQQMYIE